MKTPWKLAVVSLGLLLWTGMVPAIAAEPAAGSSPASPDQNVPDDYQIGPGDTLQISVYQSAELSVTVPVRPDGKISTQLVENMVAVGKTPSQLARDIEKVLVDFVKAPIVTVIVTNAVSASRKVTVIGQVRQSVSLPYREGLRVLDLLQAAGGVTEFAAPNRAHIAREVNGKTEKIPVKLRDLLNKGDLQQNKLLQPGDVLVIPESMV